MMLRSIDLLVIARAGCLLPLAFHSSLPCCFQVDVCSLFQWGARTIALEQFVVRGHKTNSAITSCLHHGIGMM